VLRARGRARALVTGLSVAAAATGLLASRDACADSCDHPDLIETIPDDLATGVPVNASLFAHYATNAQYVNEKVTLEQTTGAGDDAGVVAGSVVPITVTFDQAEGLLQATPMAPLMPDTTYVVQWPSLRGLDTATLGTKASTHFTTGTKIDTAAPTFGGIKSVSWDVSRDHDSCTGRVEERYVFDLALGDAADDGGRDSLSLVVFETSGPGIDASAPQPLLVQRIPPAGQSVRITSNDLVGHVCFAAIVQDLTGKASTSGAPMCVDTVAPPFFYSCAMSAGRHRWSAELLMAAAALVVLAKRRARGQTGTSSRREGAG
jgi:hypothetical protein